MISKTNFLEKILLSFFKKHGRNKLPWRNTKKSPYEIWVSEIFLQQTQVSRVIPFYTRFLKNFPNILSLYKISFEEFLPFYEGLGYYARGRNMLKTAQILCEEYDTKFPKTKEELLSLPGIGPYTASAILAFGYKKNVLAFDTNGQKVCGRFFFGNKKTKIPPKILDSFTKNLKELSLAFMDFGSLVCTKTPQCMQCPLSSRCQYFLEKGKQEISLSPLKKTSKKLPAVVFLHKNFKVWYSSEYDFYAPFMFPQEKNSRASIKAFFETFGLKVSVRPPYKTEIFQGKKRLFIRAQVLSGNIPFAEFSLNGEF